MLAITGHLIYFLFFNYNAIYGNNPERTAGPLGWDIKSPWLSQENLIELYKAVPNSCFDIHLSEESFIENDSIDLSFYKYKPSLLLKFKQAIPNKVKSIIERLTTERDKGENKPYLWDILICATAGFLNFQEDSSNIFLVLFIRLSYGYTPFQRWSLYRKPLIRYLKTSALFVDSVTVNFYSLLKNGICHTKPKMLV